MATPAAANNAAFRISALSTGAQIRVGNGWLHTVTIGVPGVTSNTLTIFDGTGVTGAVLVRIDTTTANTYVLDVVYNTGLFYTLTGGTAGDITIAYMPNS